MSQTRFAPAERMKNVYASPPRKVLERARELEREGRKIIHMEIGEPDFDTPPDIIECTVDALRGNMTHYESNRGNTPLRKEIAGDILDNQGVSYDPETEILTTAGVAPGIFESVLAYVGEGDEVITFAPQFMNYDIDTFLAGGKNVVVALKQENDFQIDIAEFKAAITPKTKLVIFNNPHNPTGVVHREECVRQLAETIKEHDLLVVTDEVYDKIVYDGVKFVSLASLPGMKERTILLNGFSKAYAMTGWRMGYVATDAALMTPILRVHQYLATAIPTFSQVGLAKGMHTASSRQKIREMVAIFQDRRDELLRLLAEVPNISYTVPTGAFYIMINIEKLGLSGEDFAMRILEEKGVALVMASAFGAAYANYVRISYATSTEDIREGIARLKEFVLSL